VFTEPSGQGQSATETNVSQLAPTALTFGHFVCYGPKPTGATSVVFTVRVGVPGSPFANTSATCTIPTGGGTAVTNAISLTIPAGDLFNVSVAQGNTSGNVYWSLAP
jgi:hypothetical protein